MNLEIEKLSKRYPNGVQALAGVSLTIPPGMFGLLGPNGAGKSSLMRTIATLQEADAGAIRFDGIDVLRDKERVREVLGYLPQEFGVYPRVTAVALLDHLAVLKGLRNAKQRKELVHDLLRRVNLEHAKDRRLGTYSGGMKQRFGIAQALLGNPKLVIVDEPTAGLDPEERVRFLNLLAEIGDDVVIILSTHIVADVEDLCRQVAIISEGKVAQSGDPLELIRGIEGKIFRKFVSHEDLAGVQAARQVVSTRRVAGRLAVRIYSEAPAGDGFESVPPDLEDVYFLAIHGARAVTAPAAATLGAMVMLFAIARFELRKRLGMISSYVYFALFFAFGLVSMLAAGGAFSNVSAGAGTEKVLANSPIIVQAMINTLSTIGILVSASVFGQAVHQDFESQSDALFFTKPVSKTSYLGGRFLGALAFSVLVLTSIAFGVLLASVSPFWVTRSFFGPTRLAAFAWPYLTFVVPNLVFTGAIFFSLGALARKMTPVYVGAVLMVIGWLAASSLARDIDNRTLAALIDPFGNFASGVLTRYWTASEKNTRLIPLTGLLLYNRLLWCSVGATVLAFTFARFRLAHQGTAERARAILETTEKRPALARNTVITIEHRPAFELARLTWLGFVETVKNTYFAVIVLGGAGFSILVVHLSGRIQGTATLPVTYRVAGAAAGGFSVFMLALLTFYAGEIAFRERDARMDQIMDALPIPTWVPFLSKLFALWMMEAVILVALGLAGMAYQTVLGFHRYEPLLYLQILFGIEGPPMLFLAVLALVIHSVLANKYVGHAAMVVFYLVGIFQDRLGLEHTLFKYGDHPGVTYSDMNGFGHFIRPVVYYNLYWTGIATILAVIGALFWTRGSLSSFSSRASVAKARLSRSYVSIASAGLLLSLVTGAVIVHNTLILNTFHTTKADEAAQADYEKKYKRLENTPQPRITGVVVTFDIFPETETLEARGSYTLENKTAGPIEAVYVQMPSEQPVKAMSVGGVDAPIEKDFELGFLTYKLQKPLAPGETIPLTFDLVFHDVGFKDRGNRTDIAANGTFFNSGNLPHLGYESNAELVKDNVRKKYDLAPRERMKDLHDKAGLANNLISTDADWITFEATVSTSPDQIAIVPGYLDREWTENGRRFFHYKMDAKILDFFSVLSGRYEVRKDHWNDVNLEVYYHPSHTYDVDEMIRGMKESLAYASDSFGPYQHHQARIIEFPRYASFAQSFPNTIPYSEAIGFIAKVDQTKAEDVDYPVFITAHEIGHQWWAHQVIGARVQGVTMLDETLAEYTGMMVMKKLFGPAKMRRFLKHEVDGYLSQRGFEDKKEMPLMRVENQMYIHYNKGGAVMYALQDYIGEDKVNQALRAFLDKTKYVGPPYPISEELVDEFKKVTPPELSYLIHDFFEAITLYDNRALSATAKKRPDGKYDITVKISAKKLQADDLGKEVEVPMEQDRVDIGGIDEQGDAICLGKQSIKAGESEVTFVCDQLPSKAGIDPMLELLDRHPDDNLTAPSVELVAQGSKTGDPGCDRHVFGGQFEGAFELTERALDETGSLVGFGQRQSMACLLRV